MVAVRGDGSGGVIVVLSTSSPVASVALIDGARVLAERSELALRTAGRACLDALQQLLSEVNNRVDNAEGFAVDVGPGSFGGVKVGVTLAKALAFATRRPVAPIAAFDLIAAAAVAFPGRRGAYWLRKPGEKPRLVDELPTDVVGYGPGIGSRYPLASRAAGLTLRWIAPWELLPDYGLPPSISLPKRRTEVRHDPSSS